MRVDRRVHCEDAAVFQYAVFQYAVFQYAVFQYG
jgi:hypothetical protein